MDRLKKLKELSKKITENNKLQEQHLQERMKLLEEINTMRSLYKKLLKEFLEEEIGSPLDCIIC